MFYVKLRENYPNNMLVLSTGEFVKTNPNPKGYNEYFLIKRDSYELKELLRQGILILKKDNEKVEESKVEELKVESIAKSNDVKELKVEELKVEESKIEESKIEESKVEEPII